MEDSLFIIILYPWSKWRKKIGQQESCLFSFGVRLSLLECCNDAIIYIFRKRREKWEDRFLL